uniref:hypothetical protein n=1 Tax=uncultured Flavobacterium sp. TaxID=165435 RepID=UPI0025D9EE65
MDEDYKNDPKYQKGYLQAKSMAEMEPDAISKLSKLDDHDPFIQGIKDGYMDYIEQQRQQRERQKLDKDPEYLRGYTQGKNVASVYPELASHLEKLPQSDPHTLGLINGSKDFFNTQKEGTVTPNKEQRWDD